MIFSVLDTKIPRETVKELEWSASAKLDFLERRMGTRQVPCDLLVSDAGVCFYTFSTRNISHLLTYMEDLQLKYQIFMMQH